MKNIFIKSSLALALAAVTAVPVTSMAASHEKKGMAEETEAPGVTVSGRFRAAVVCNDTGENDCGLENRSSRFRIAASQDMGNGLSAFGKYEFGVALDEGRLKGGLSGVTNHIDADTGELLLVTGNPDNTRRLSYVGIKGGFGEISVGSRWTPLYNTVASPVDPNQMHGGTWNGGIGFITSFRRGDGLHYKKGFGDVGSAHVMLVLDDGDEGNDFVDEFQVGLRFNAGPVGIGIAHGDIKDSDSVTGVNVGFAAGPVDLGATYFIGENADAFALAAGFGVGPGKIWVTAGMDDPDGSDASPKSFGVEYSQQMTKHARWFAGVEQEDNDGGPGSHFDGEQEHTHYGIGMRLEF